MQPSAAPNLEYGITRLKPCRLANEFESILQQAFRVAVLFRVARGGRVEECGHILLSGVRGPGSCGVVPPSRRYASRPMLTNTPRWNSE